MWEAAVNPFWKFGAKPMALAIDIVPIINVCDTLYQGKTKKSIKTVTFPKGMIISGNIHVRNAVIFIFAVAHFTAKEM
jgi:hypothetical protein